MEDEKKSKIIGIAVIVIIIVGIGTMLLISKNMHKQNNNKTTSTSTTTSTTKKTETTTTKIEDTSSFRMVIEDIFTVSGGITIDGKISQGTIHKGDKIEILGDNKVITAVANKIYILKKEVDSATKDDYISIHIKDVNKSQVSRGQTIASPSTIEATNKFKAKVYINTLKEGGNDTPIYNNYNLYIIKGNTQNKLVSLIYILNNDKTLNTITDSINKYNININFFIDSTYLYNNINLIDTLSNNEIYNYGSNGKYTKDNLIITNNIINNKSNNKSIYCLFLNKEESSHNNCANNKMFSLHIDKFATLNYVKNNLSNGSLFLINNTQELNNIIEYILSKGYKIVPLSSLITE